MDGPIARMIQSQGQEYTVRNANGSGGRSTPSYGETGTVTAVLESRGMPQTVTDSDGTEVETDLELRVVDDEVALVPAGSGDGYPTLLDGPSGRTYRLLDTYVDDGGVTVLTVVTE